MYIQKYNKYKDKYCSLKNELYGGYDETYFDTCRNTTNFITKTHQLLIHTTGLMIERNRKITTIPQGKAKYKIYIEQLFFLTPEYHKELTSLIDDFSDEGNIDAFKKDISGVLYGIKSTYSIPVFSDFDEYFIFDDRPFSPKHNDHPHIVSLNGLVKFLEDTINSTIIYDTLVLIKTIRDKIFRRKQVIFSHEMTKRLIILFEFILVHLMSEKNMKYYINVILLVLKIIIKKMIIIIDDNISLNYPMLKYDDKIIVSDILVFFISGIKHMVKFLKNDKIIHAKKILEQHMEYLTGSNGSVQRLKEQIKVIIASITLNNLENKVSRIYVLYEQIKSNDSSFIESEEVNGLSLDTYVSIDGPRDSLDLIIKSNHLTFLKNLKIYLLRTFQKNIKKLKYDDKYTLIDEITLHLMLLSDMYYTDETTFEKLLSKLNNIDRYREIFLILLNRIIDNSIDKIIKTHTDDEFLILFTGILQQIPDNIREIIKDLKALFDMLLEYKTLDLNKKRSHIFLPHFKKALRNILISHETYLDFDQQFKKHIDTILNLLNRDVSDESYVHIIIDGFLTIIYRIILVYQNSLKSIKGAKCDKCNICSKPVICSINVVDLNDYKVTCSSCRKSSSEDKYNGFKCGHIVCQECVTCTEQKCDKIDNFDKEGVELYEYFFCPSCNMLSYFIKYDVDASIHIANCIICSELKRIEGFLRCGHTNICSKCVNHMKKTDQTERENIHRLGRLERLVGEIMKISTSTSSGFDLTETKNKFLSKWGEPLIVLERRQAWN